MPPHALLSALLDLTVDRMSVCSSLRAQQGTNDKRIHQDTQQTFSCVPLATIRSLDFLRHWEVNSLTECIPKLGGPAEVTISNAPDQAFSISSADEPA